MKLTQIELILVKSDTSLIFPFTFSRNADKQRDCKGEAISLKLHPLSSPPTES